MEWDKLPLYSFFSLPIPASLNINKKDFFYSILDMKDPFVDAGGAAL